MFSEIPSSDFTAGQGWHSSQTHIYLPSFQNTNIQFLDLQLWQQILAGARDGC